MTIPPWLLTWSFISISSQHCPPSLEKAHPPEDSIWAWATQLLLKYPILCTAQVQGTALAGPDYQWEDVAVIGVKSCHRPHLDGWELNMTASPNSRAQYNKRHSSPWVYTHFVFTVSHRSQFISLCVSLLTNGLNSYMPLPLSLWRMILIITTFIFSKNENNTFMFFFIKMLINSCPFLKVVSAGYHCCASITFLF